MSSHGVPPSGSDEHILSDAVPQDIPSLDEPPSRDDEVPSLNIHFQPGGSDDGIGSSVFEKAMIPVTPDPILGELADAEEAAHHHLDPEEGLPGLSDLNPADAGLDLDRSPPANHPRHADHHAEASGDSEVHDEVVYVNGPNWPMLLLASYASAVTLALIWFVVIPRLRGKGDLEGFAPGAASVPVGSRRAPHKIEPAPPIPAERMAKLGQPLKIGSLEFTPLETARENVKLRRTSISGEVEEKEGGNGALSLRIRVHNLSNDAVFSPLDEAFVRDHDSGLSDSFVELGSGERVYLYPLPVESEWSIIGQTFPELKPGEVKETVIVTSADFPNSAAGMTWHLRLRTGLEATEVIGVTIPADK